MSRWIRAALLAVVAVLAVSQGAHAQYPPALPPTLGISQEIGPPGFTFTATVTNCVPGQRVVFVLGDLRVEAICDPITLQASAVLTAPPQTGSFTVNAEFFGTCSPAVEPCLVLTQTIQVVAAPPSTLPDTGGDGGGGSVTTLPDTGGSTGGGGGNLPRTGSNGVSSMLSAGLVAVAVGAGLFVVARVRRRPATN